MPLSALDATSISRSLSQIADRDDDLAEAYFERLEEVELPAADEVLGLRVRREEGFAVRLVRQGQTWLAARDAIDATAFAEAIRQVARALPNAAYPPPGLELARHGEPWEAAEVLAFPGEVSRHIRRHLNAFPYRLTVRRHRRWLRVVGTRLAPEPQSECFYSCVTQLPWGRHGAVLSALDADAAEGVAAEVTALFRARDASPPAPHRGVAVLAPAAAAVLLHEVVSHALETDTLVLGGRVEAALGVRVGSAALDVLDDPCSAPPGVRRTSDDEGSQVVRRWLLRAGVVEQPLADLFAARASSRLTPGAARRGSRHLPPAPRSTHLTLLPSERQEADLLAEAEGGLFLPQVSSGRLDPLSGRFTLHLPFARRIRHGAPGEPVGPCRLSGQVAELLSAVSAVGGDARPAGAGWCAKGGVRLPVWATTPSLRLEGARVEA